LGVSDSSNFNQQLEEHPAYPYESIDPILLDSRFDPSPPEQGVFVPETQYSQYFEPYSVPFDNEDSMLDPSWFERSSQFLDHRNHEDSVATPAHEPSAAGVLQPRQDLTCEFCSTSFSHRHKLK